jgi:hypothetical protein
MLFKYLMNKESSVIKDKGLKGIDTEQGRVQN